MKGLDLKKYVIQSMQNHEWFGRYGVMLENDLLCKVVFRNSIVKFVKNENYGYVDCYVVNPRDLINKRGFEKRYYVSGILKALDNFDVILKDQLANENDGSYIDCFVKILNNQLIDVVKGMFFWTDRYNEINDNEIEICEVMDGYLDSEDFLAINKKMLTNDVSWKIDLENWKKKR
ncbi:hypothetical protein [Aquimarina macrocephali]|uniref:hypothetical protein n=1 Tax=Aquimarina macrocephali TaxID=666563 RepID=UPI000466C077|nr:hypothetical protein [Aquimarina macrocephali]